MINYFVSSTFRDMQSERDILQNNILPEIRKIANVRGQEVFLTDLRWGIDTTDTDTRESMIKILSICMREIDNCRPHMIVLLGNRYGSIPDKEILDSFLETEPGKDIPPEDADKSITEMEIIHGILRHQGAGSFTICIRDPLPKEEMEEELIPAYFETDPEYEEKLAELKEQLSAKYTENIIRYSAAWDRETRTVTGLEDFSEQLFQRLSAQIMAEDPGPLTPETAQANADDLFISSGCKTFAGRASYLRDIREFMDLPGGSYLILTGPSGVGKSALMARIAETYADTNRVLAFFCGNSPYIRTIPDLMRHLVYRLCAVLHEDHAEYAEDRSDRKLRANAETLMRRIDDELLIIIDSIDSILSQKEEWDLLPEGNAKCRIIISINSDLKERFPLGIGRTVLIDNMDEEELSEMIDARLTSLRKELPGSVKKILLKKVVYHTPLYASMVFGRAAVLNQFDFRKIGERSAETGDSAKALYDYIGEEIDSLPDRETDLAIRLAEISAYGFLFPFRTAVLRILSLFPDGLRTEDIIGIAAKLGEKISFLDLKTYLNCLSSLIYTTHNNRNRFLHKKIFDAFAEKFSDSAGPVCRAVCAYLKELPDDDSLKLSDFLRISYQCGDHVQMAEYLSSLYLMAEDMPGEEHRIGFVEMAMYSLRKVFQRFRHQDEAQGFICSLINGIPECSVRGVYGLCCSFLFTFDIFFDNLGLEGKADDIMQLLYDKCIRVLYPHRYENPLYLRAVYVCCEQVGIRTWDYQKKYDAYREFNHCCLEMFQITDDTFKNRADIQRDLSLSFSKLAYLWRQRDWRQAVKYYDRAIEIAEIPCRDERRAFILRELVFSTGCEEASCIVQKANQNNQIGWPMDDEMTEKLGKAKKMLLSAMAHYETVSSESKYRKLAYCCMNLSDWARAVGEDDLFVKYAEQMIGYAGEAYSRDHSVSTYDLIRNGEFRLGRFLQDDSEKEPHLKESFRIASEMRHELDTDSTRRILYYAGSDLLWLYAERLRKMDPAGDADDVSGLCLQILTDFVPVLGLLLEEDDGDKNSRTVSYVFQRASDNVRIQRRAAITALHSDAYQTAFKKTLAAYNLLLAMKDLSDRKGWLIELSDLSHLLSVCAHNARVDSYRGKSENFRYSAYEMAADAKLLYCKLRYEMLFPADEPPDCIKRYNDNKALNPYYSSTLAWLEFVVECISGDEEEQLWDHLERIDFPVPNWSDVTFDLLDLVKQKMVPDEQIRTVGMYFYEHLRENRVQKLLYFSTLFENITLEYAYDRMDFDAAQEIIENGYDRYLELSALYIIRKHDRREFYKRVHELKFICLQKHRSLISHRELEDITGSLFVSEADALFKQILEVRRAVAPDDPRRKTERGVRKYRHVYE